jgi:DNA-binding CsgD family transcriptional regulator
MRIQSRERHLFKWWTLSLALIGNRFGVSEKTVAKALAWIRGGS